MLGINTSLLREYLREKIRDRLQYIDSISDQIIDVEIDGRQYSIGFERQGNSLSVFVSSESDAINLNSPQVRFKIGEFLLPDEMKAGMDLDLDYTTPSYIEYNTEHCLTPEEQAKLLDYIRENII